MWFNDLTFLDPTVASWSEWNVIIILLLLSCTMCNVQWISCVYGIQMVTVVEWLTAPWWQLQSSCLGTALVWNGCTALLFLVWSDRVHQISLQRIRKQDFRLLYSLEFIFCSTKRCTDRTRFFDTHNHTLYPIRVLGSWLFHNKEWYFDGGLWEPRVNDNYRVMVPTKQSIGWNSTLS